MEGVASISADFVEIDDEITLRLPNHGEHGVLDPLSDRRPRDEGVAASTSSGQQDPAEGSVKMGLAHVKKRDDDIPLIRQDMATPQECCLVDSTLHRPVIKPDWFLPARLTCGRSIYRHRPDERGKDEFAYKKGQHRFKGRL